MNIQYLFEYIWIDSDCNLRSKNRILVFNNYKIDVSLLPLWNFDGSSTGQADAHNTDVIIKPVKLYKNPFVDYIDSFLVLCECYNTDMTPHPTNTRVKCLDSFENYKEFECLFGIEQEYVIYDRSDKPYGWLDYSDPGNGGQGPYYCSVGGDRCFGRDIVDKHLEYCLKAGISICGTNAEVMASQWEFQVGVRNAIDISDDLWMARYILNRVSEKFNCRIVYHPKPKPKWNGSGAHTNFSTKDMRNDGGINHINNACNLMNENHKHDINYYGQHNELRLVGAYETSNMDNFSYGVGNRSTSVRIPIHVYNEGKGYLEDRRPASNMDPYLVTHRLMETICKKN